MNPHAGEPAPADANAEHHSVLARFLPNLAWERPVTVMMVLLATFTLGLISWFNIPVQMLPDGFEPKSLWVRIPYRNASPTEVDERIVRPILAQLDTVSGVEGVHAWASSGMAGFNIDFYGSVDMDSAYDDVVDRLERAMLEIPDDVERYWIFKYNSDDQPVVWAGVAFSDGVEDEYQAVERLVKPRLQRIPGVAAVDDWGVGQRVIYVDYDREKLLTHGVNLGEVQRGLAGDNFQMAGGEVIDHGLVQNIRSLARLSTMDELKTWPMREDGRVLGDIADISLRGVRSSAISRINGEEAAALAITKESTANTIEVAQAVEAALAELEQDPRLKGSRFFVFFNQGELIADSTNNLAQSAWMGGALAVIVLYVFLRNLKMTLLIALSIPLCLLLTVAIMDGTDMSLNLIALMGLMLAVGMVVDNAIVVVEAIYARRAAGASIRAAAVEGAAEVNLAITASTATTMVVFLPVILMTGEAEISFFMAEIGLPVVYALGTSLFVALVLAPLATRALANEGVPPDPPWVERLIARYARTLAWTLRQRTDAIGALLLAFVLTAAVAAPGLRIESGAESNLNDFDVQFTVPPDATPRERNAICEKLEAVVEAHRAEWGVRVFRIDLRERARRGMMAIYLEEDGPMDRAAVIEAAKAAMPANLPGVKISMGWGDGGDDDSARRITLRVHGEEMQVLRSLADEIARRLRTVDGVLDARTGATEGELDEIHLPLDRQALRRFGVTAQDIGQTIAFAMRGTELEPLRQGESEVTVLTQLSPDDRENVATLLDFPIWSPSTMGVIPARTFTDPVFAQAPASIDRTDGRTAAAVTVDLAEGVDAEEVSADLEAALADFALPRGYAWSLGDFWEGRAAENAALVQALWLSIAFVFLLMGALFESFVLPLAVVITIPLAALGAIWSLYLTNTPMDTMAGIGLIILVGVVVNNGIVLVDIVGQLRREGLSRSEALVEAGRRRLRPILMTAATTIFGLIPMAFGSSNLIGIPYAPLGRCLIGGMVASTLLTLYFVPLAYTVLDDVAGASRRMAAYALRRSS